MMRGVLCLCENLGAGCMTHGSEEVGFLGRKLVFSLCSMPPYATAKSVTFTFESKQVTCLLVRHHGPWFLDPCSIPPPYQQGHHHETPRLGFFAFG